MAVNKLILINENDDAATAIEDIAAGERLRVGGVRLDAVSDVPAGHKIAVRDIARGERVRKYGEPIGAASRDISAGEWIHSHNLVSALDEESEYVYEPRAVHLPAPPESAPRTFEGFLRSDGSAGVRNEIFIIPTVGCVNGVCRELEREAAKLAHGSLGGVYALTHQFGCSQLGEDAESIRRLLCAAARNPNAAYVLFVGLGCENNSLEGIRGELDGAPRKNVFYLNAQDVGDELESGMDILRPLIDAAAGIRRLTLPVSLLRIGLKCGGSDGFSGITANPAVGEAADILIALGGSAVLTEVPEMFGAERGLMNKCADARVFGRLRDLILRYRRFYADNGFPVYENPSPGNRAGGITTLEEKSLGCVRKAGSAAITDCLEYAETAARSGVTVLDAPGNDPIAATALAAAGCQLVLFTTGRGTPFSTFVPTVKIASNRRLSEFKSRWIDFDASGAGAGAELYNRLIDIASGGECRSEGVREAAFFKRGVTL